MKVYKFGGSSVGTPDRITSIIQLIAAQAQREDVRAVVFSAFQGVTDQLIETANLAAAGRPDYTDNLKSIENRHLDAVRALIDIHHQSNTMAVIKMMLNDLDDILQGVHLIKELSPRSKDFVLSFGERLSNLIISRALVSAGHDCEFLDARKLIKTDDSFGNALVLQDETHENIRRHFSEHPLLQVVTGFIASTAKDETTTLGRGGSDYTASILGAALDVDEVQIWTDVDGVLTADPRKVSRAFPVPVITYEEAMEMSHFGAKVIYPPTIQPLMSRGIPIRIKNTFNAAGHGTLITANADPGTYSIRGISSINDVSLVRLQGTGMVGVAGVAQRIFATMARNSINVILISQASSEYSVCFAVKPEDAPRARILLMEEFEQEMERRRINEVSIESGQCIIAVVGENMRATPGIAGKVFQALGENGVNISAIAQGSSELNISMVIAQDDEKKALSAIHDAFFLAGLKTLHLFVIGAGLIGKTLIDMIGRQRRQLGDDRHLDIRVIGLANSRKMYFDLNGIPESNCIEKLEQSGGKMELDAFLEHMLSLNLPNSVLVDCTSNEQVSSRYLEVLDRSISVVTPNKKAASGRYVYYQELHAAAQRSNVRYLYETNVGAGLPVIRTVRDFVGAGDRIQRIEGVLSGTISYLLNTFQPGMKFSEIVSKARGMGYTEPDPRDDLNGMDVARKILILAREAGLQLELSDVQVDAVLPDTYFDSGTVDEFMTRLPEVDAHMDELAAKAAADGKKLRYIARVEGGKAEVRLMAVGSEHPAYALTASDNLVMVNSDCYHDRPLVVMGPGAGPEVTASGVLADIIKVS
ncbi:MAG: bifunctional aspartate kinase/homoserine dehydrogenase I [Bacteroidetes bacterium]|nr:bifunctional aspartate kinase/homoserine dehydrogenase I [Bacteroidota bacterium]MCH8523747.1 bifunctional aspartate kinase/homoserine dehydrogenase I [Balneolales bacterium]